MPVLYVPFTKMHGAGNDFIVLDNRFFRFSDAELAAVARRFCPRRFGVGADGLLALDPPEDEGDDYRMRYRNADGSPAGMCGNGARCLARFAREAGLDAEPLTFAADAGRYSASVATSAPGPVRLFVPPPRRYRPAVGLETGESVSYIWTGTHHAVIFVDDLDAAGVASAGPAVRRDAAFAPEGTNVNFVLVATRDRVRVRTFEKGVEGETLACGTGALASALVAHLDGRVAAPPITVEARGGTLEVGWHDDGGEIRDLYLEGPAVTTFTGVLEVDPAWLAAETAGR
jgi:diaminopimelate epimerase